MTCVIAWRHEDRIYMAADSMSSNGHLKMTRTDKKIYQVGEAIIGHCGSPRMGQILAHDFEFPEHPEGMSNLKYMVTLFTKAARERFKELGYSHIQNNVESGGTFLVGYRGQIFMVQSDFQISESVLPYVAIGSGQEWAMGSMYTNFYADKPVEDKLLEALEAAAYFCVSVGGPFYWAEI